MKKELFIYDHFHCVSHFRVMMLNRDALVAIPPCK